MAEAASDQLFQTALGLYEAGKLREAESFCRTALAKRPNDADLFNCLGNALAGQRRFDEAITAFESAVAIHPAFAAAMNNHAMALKEIGRLDEAMALFERAMAIEPDQSTIDRNRVFTLHYLPSAGPLDILREARKWNDRHAQRFGGVSRNFNRDRSADRRLRVGYVSPDFKTHCQILYTIPLLSNHNHGEFEIFCYADVPQPDEFTEYLRSQADVWRSTVGMSDEQIVELVRADQIDILVDLTMHMSRGRLLVFARRAAPVQVSWLAYPSTTGVSEIEYRLTDPFLDAPSGVPMESAARDRLYSEKSIRLPETFWCFSALTSEPAVNALPALTEGAITFGCLNNFCKINEPLLKLWSRIMRAVERSRLIILAPPGSAREFVLKHLAVDASRIEFVPFQERPKYLETYLRIDLGLDPYPYNGHTSSLDSLWMGVPVVTLAGQTAVSRAGLSQAANLKLMDLVAYSPEQYVQRAIEWAGDLPRLSRLRKALRGKMTASPLMDAPRFARRIEAAYRQMWRNWITT